MRKILLSTMLFFSVIVVNAQTDSNLGIIPAPVTIQKANGSFALNSSVVIVNKQAKNTKIVGALRSFLASKGLNLPVVATAKPGQRVIEFTETGADKLPAEGYQISINSQQVKLLGKDAGLFYALQSLLQMMPESKKGVITLQNVDINDYPRFAYRGLHLDVGRHFFPLDFIKKYIDVMASYKLNNFHWHLTEDQGWRLEIKKYPKLTEFGSSRNGTNAGRHGGKDGSDNTVYKGYYTQAEAKEIVAYAAERYVNVIPEIELPGHASAAIAAYPELSCFPDRDTFVPDRNLWSGPTTGKQVQQGWGVFDDIFVPSENTFNFLENVLTEVMAIFPSKYIHIGGDEAPKNYWKESAFCQQLIKEKGLKDEHELQSYFIQRIEKFLNAKGRSIIGWDEILEGGLAPNATVMSWRGEAGGIEAARQHHDVLMTPGSNGLYFDHKQSNSPDEPITIGGFSNVEKVYNYNPVPSVLTPEQAKYIKGVQANLWTEYIKTPEKAEYMLFPRVYALAEIAWTPVQRKNFDNFNLERLPLHLAKLDKSNSNYWVPTPIGNPGKSLVGESQTITLTSPILGAKIYYTLNGGFRPSENANLYTQPIKVFVPQGQTKILKTIVIAPSGKRSVVSETALTNPAPAEVKK